MKLSKKQINLFQEKILDWYTVHKRNLPWRRTRDPYKILISEVMSQQTQISRVIPKFTAWIEAFPTVQSLAEASVADVLAHWSGLGYNRRALNLKKEAEKIVREYDGTFPQKEKDLLDLPGIGQYTARAVLCFAFNKQVAVVDTNVRKVIITQLGQDENDKKAIEALAQQLLPKQQAYDWNQALMDYASHVLKREKITIPKQSKFIGSHRYYRGQILKQLLLHKQISVSDIGQKIKKDYTPTEEQWLTSLVKELVDEGFIVVTNGVMQLAS